MIQIGINRIEDSELMYFEAKDMDLPGVEINEKLDREDLEAIANMIHEMLDSPVYEHVIGVSYTTK